MEAAIDMKVLRAVHVLTTCGSVTKTADLLNVSPGAISYLLNKARRATGSALFFRTKNKMIPNTIAKDLSERYQKINDEFYDSEDGVNTIKRTLTVSTYSLIELMLTVVTANDSEFNKGLHFLPPEINDEQRQIKIRNKEVDIDIGTLLPRDKSIIASKVFSCGVKIITRKNHPKVNGEFTIENWLNLDQIVWSRGMHLISNNHNHTNRFNELLEKRKIAAVSSSSLSMVNTCANSDLIMFMPDALIGFLKDMMNIDVYDVPDELNMDYECYVHYHHTLVNDPHLNNVLSNLKNMLHISYN